MFVAALESLGSAWDVLLTCRLYSDVWTGHISSCPFETDLLRNSIVYGREETAGPTSEGTSDSNGVAYFSQEPTGVLQFSFFLTLMTQR